MHKSNMGDDGSSNAEMDIVPGYLELVTRAYSVMSSAFRDCKDCGLEMSTRTLMDHAHITWKEIFLFFMCVVMWTQMRKGLTAFVFQPFGRWCRLHPKDVLKMPESAWKLVFYTMSWSYSTHLLFFTNYSFFQNPPSVFNSWRSGMEVPTDISIAYLIQGSFYGHSIYSTVYMDTWRKDSLVMVGHHFITLALITFSYAFRYHNIGVLVLFLHDINDIQLEFTKVNVYFKTRGGKEHFINDVLSNIGVVSFSITWFWFRLYWFPLKVLWASCVTSIQTVPNIPFYFFFNTLLFILLLMNIYWFLFIVLFVVKVLTGQMKGVNDVREYEDGDDADDQTSADGKQVKNGIAKKHQ
ncbi:ceramide synthase 1 [Triplophysa rosa]|uniref:Ceramide synthase 1 n=1 Tax=Triplophysa rosa TaxID=992332 RepID=A0A9W7T7E6_TRIRA|nr:ceramide synthase 1 [Triplophysa rosa]KAI7791064.1 putative ceramide synthase 1 [Triplophysa rosa]